MQWGASWTSLNISGMGWGRDRALYREGRSQYLVQGGGTCTGRQGQGLWTELRMYIHDWKHCLPSTLLVGGNTKLTASSVCTKVDANDFQHRETHLYWIDNLTMSRNWQGVWKWENINVNIIINSKTMSSIKNNNFISSHQYIRFLWSIALLKYQMATSRHNTFKTMQWRRS